MTKFTLSGKRRALFEKMLERDGEPAARRVVIPQREGSGPWPLSFAQRRLWFLNQLSPQSPFYNVFTAVPLRVPVDAAVLRRSLNDIIRRHESLRTTFVSDDGDPVQVIAPELDLDLRQIDLTYLAGPERDAECDRLAVEAARTPFDLASGPLFRASLIRKGPQDFVLLLVLHHIVCDGWSLGVLGSELSAGYAAYLSGRTPAVPALPIQFADFAAWQSQWLTSDAQLEQTEYWKRQLAAVPPLELPADRPRPAIASYRGAHIDVRFPGDLSGPLHALCHEESATPFMVLLAAFAAVLHRYTSQTDIAIGTPTSGRTRTEIENLIGFFVNTLVIRVDLSRDPTFRTLVRRVRTTALAAYANQDLPFEKIVEEVQPERDLARNPLFQVMFQFFSATGRPGSDAGPDLSMNQPNKGTALFDFALHLSEDAAGVYGQAEYSVDLIEAATAELMVAHLKMLLSDALVNPDRPIAQLQLLTEVEQRQAIATASGPAAGYPNACCLHHLVSAQASRTPDRVAVALDEESLTYRQLDELANQVAHYLRARRTEEVFRLKPEATSLEESPAPRSEGVGEWCVAICLERSVRQLVCMLGALKAGAVYLPLDPGYPPDRLTSMAAAARGGLILAEDRLASHLSGPGRAVVAIDRAWPEIAQQPATAPADHTVPDNLAYVIHTSGSTGEPKRIGMTHRAIANLVWSTTGEEPERPPAILQFASASFDVSVQEIMSAWCRGGTLVLIDERTRRDVEALWQEIAKYRIDHLFLPVVALQMLADTVPSRLRLSLPIRKIVTAGEQLKISTRIAALFERLPGCTLENQYGPSESHVVTAHALTGPPSAWPVLPSIGRPIANTRVYVLDAGFNLVPTGVTGEIHIAGDCLTRGYLQSPGQTAERFVPDPFGGAGARMYRTGDLGRYRPDGTLEFLGRVDRQLKMRGFRIEPGEIEHAIEQHPAIREAVVVARSDGDVTRLVAYVVPRAAGSGDGRIEVARVRQFLQSRLPGHMVPAGIVPVDRIALTPSGKVAHDRLPAPDWSALAGADSDTAVARTAVEQTLAGIWTRTLGLDRVGMNDDFFADLGGHSLLATRVMSLVRDAFGIALPLSDIFEAPTVARLAERIDRAMAAS